MTLFRHRTLLDKAFAIGLGLKALDGLGELIGGLWLLFLSPLKLQTWVGLLLVPELREDPHDFVALHVMQWAAHFNQGAVWFAAAYLLSHGVAKLVVITEILRGRLWAYPGLIVLTALFVVYQLYHMGVAGPSLGYLLLTLFDLLIIALTVGEYVKIRRQRERRR